MCTDNYKAWAYKKQFALSERNLLTVTYMNKVVLTGAMKRASPGFRPNLGQFPCAIRPKVSRSIVNYHFLTSCCVKF